MRAALAAGSAALLLAGGATGARGSNVPSPITELHVVQVDLEAAQTYESLAQRAANAVKRRGYLLRAEAALQGALPAVKALTPPPELVSAARQSGATNDVSGVADAFKRALAAIAKPKVAPKHFLIDALNAAAAEMRARFCTEATTFRGAEMVNGVQLTPPQFTWRLSCPWTIRGADFEIPGHTWSAVDAGGSPTALLDGGHVLQIGGNGSTTMTLTTTDETDVYPGAEGEVVVIHGDSGTYSSSGL